MKRFARTEPGEGTGTVSSTFGAGEVWQILSFGVVTVFKDSLWSLNAGGFDGEYCNCPYYKYKCRCGCGIQYFVIGFAFIKKWQDLIFNIWTIFILKTIYETNIEKFLVWYYLNKSQCLLLLYRYFKKLTFCPFLLVIDT